MKLPPSLEKNRKVLTWLLGALVIFLGYRFGVRPYMKALSDAKAQLATNTTQLVRELEAVETAKKNPMLQEITDSVLKAVQPQLFTGRDDAVATSELGTYVGDLATEHRVLMSQSLTRPSTPLADGVRNLHIDIRAESDFQGILGFIKALEDGNKIVRIERLDITIAAKQGTGGLGGVGSDGTEAIGFQATLSGYAMGDLSAVPTSTAPGAKPASNAPRPVVGGGK